jgi:hypothetical protein
VRVGWSLLFEAPFLLRQFPSQEGKDLYPLLGLSAEMVLRKHGAVAPPFLSVSQNEREIRDHG